MRLAQAGEQSRQWLSALRDPAGSRASEIPSTPEFPLPPTDIDNISSRDATPIDLGKIRSDLKGSTRLSGLRLPRFALPSVSSLPEFSRIEHLPQIDHLTIPSFSLPGSIGFKEKNLTGASPKLNIFDQEVPGFCVTFVLLGMLFGVALGLADEREWGTLDRPRASPSPIAATLVGKLFSRFWVCLTQIIIFFAVRPPALGI